MRGAAFASHSHQQQQQHQQHYHPLLQHNHTDQKRPPSGHKMQFLQFCKTLKSANYAELRGGGSGGDSNNINTGYTSDTSLSASVRRWNSFHSTRGECHPNKFRRERKSTSPSLEYERKRYQASCNAVVGWSANDSMAVEPLKNDGSMRGKHGSSLRKVELRRGKSLNTPTKMPLALCGGGGNNSINTDNNHMLMMGTHLPATTEREHRKHPNRMHGATATTDDSFLYKSVQHSAYW